MPTCKQCQNEFVITSAEKKALGQFDVPHPKLCPDCRLQLQLCFRHNHRLYKNICAATGCEIISYISSDSVYTVYDQDYFWSNKWDALSYGQDFDFSRSFFEQFKMLFTKVPKVSMNGDPKNINSDYCSGATELKNCYLCFSAGWCEQVLYSEWCVKNTDVVDCYHTTALEIGYENIDVEESYNLYFSQECKKCTDSFFLYDCVGCTNCFGATNKRNASYLFFNEQLDEATYKQKIATLDLGNYQKSQAVKQRFVDLKNKEGIYRAHKIIASVDCLGDYISNSDLCTNCYDAVACENVINGFNVLQIKNSLDIAYAGMSELNYNCAGGYNDYNMLCSDKIRNGTDVAYCIESRNIENCFGCAGIFNKKYCILNKQYSKAEYFKLKNRIIAHMKKTGEYGDYFPADMSLHSYDDSLAQRTFPLTKTQAQKLGFYWLDEKIDQLSKATIDWGKVPRNIKNINADFLKHIYLCEQCRQGFKIISQELSFYKKHNLPLPHFCFACRTKNRLSLRRDCRLYHSTCAKCRKKISTTYAPDRPEIVYCEECYRKEVY
ncbi:MAG: hypothetical protein A2233_03480 [Candidatus Kerfeldbacteria bacterium RIFOXYA2_FULL_38_24]|uniref:Zinc-binding domain-containing protein n=1 Tax=Candidatus Kerfeldbacteria bacterium RIFOXYB2_FULL_38_14 TaxID=1798547 RepID=A0A1G2BFM6_9BACT|nr:MAG: hypothetical protein A2233_03480 [Candidatus Kerfeldbacteria bacterium RIFOXYA2_FULL_38_24]OGY87496.1 MAG: hypothetical protein A2319_03975 [Candidatus Kerfeldbacteria bacterium RIFOXYB2_FULL_38_14]OGY90232.1 MAG: hypothetical protein A2458_03665 [Candidatus Kerfeldbacteria bacterium RIFOXYC2_FULL_38_9]